MLGLANKSSSPRSYRGETRRVCRLPPRARRGHSSRCPRKPGQVSSDPPQRFQVPCGQLRRRPWGDGPSHHMRNKLIPQDLRAPTQQSSRAQEGLSPPEWMEGGRPTSSHLDAHPRDSLLWDPAGSSLPTEGCPRRGAGIAGPGGLPTGASGSADGQRLDLRRRISWWTRW